MRAPAWLATLGTLVGLLLPARADTEIVNFRTADSASAFALPFATGWKTLVPNSQSTLTVKPARRDYDGDWLACNATASDCSHYLWFGLDARPGMHSLRISYPAMDSVQYELRTFDTAEVAHHFGYQLSDQQQSAVNLHSTYARIACRRVGVLTPGTQFVEPGTVMFHLAFERLVLGAVPPVVLPAVSIAAVLIGVVCLFLPRLLAFFENLSFQCRVVKHRNKKG